MEKIPLPLKNTISAYLNLFRPEVQGYARQAYLNSAGGKKNRPQFEKFHQTCLTNKLLPVNVLRIYRQFRCGDELWPVQLNSPMFWKEFLRVAEQYGTPQTAVPPARQQPFTIIKYAIDNALYIVVLLTRGDKKHYSTYTPTDFILEYQSEIEPDFIALHPAGLALVRSGQLEPETVEGVRKALRRARATHRIVDLVHYATQRAKEVFPHATP